MSSATGTLATKTKFDFKNPRRDLQIVEENFFKWSNNHLYRTSMHDMSEKVRSQEKI